MTNSQSPQPAREEPWLAEGGPAFPVQAFSDMQFKGMSLRDYFAAHASDDDVRNQAEVLRAELMKAKGMGILPDNWRTTARYMHADAMLKTRGGAA